MSRWHVYKTCGFKMAHHGDIDMHVGMPEASDEITPTQFASRSELSKIPLCGGGTVVKICFLISSSDIQARRFWRVVANLGTTVFDRYI